MSKEDRGGSMTEADQRKIASEGGKAAHQKGAAHEWTTDEGLKAGRKGGTTSKRRTERQVAERGNERE